MKKYDVYYEKKLKDGYLKLTVEAKNKTEAIKIVSKYTMINQRYLTCDIDKVKI